MRFEAEGTFPVEVIDAKVTAPKFSTEPGVYDIAIQVKDEAEHEDWWRTEWSDEYGRGNFADRTQKQISMATLKKLGWEHGQEFGKLSTLVGTKTTATVKERDGYFNISFLGGGGNTPQALTGDALAVALAAMAVAIPDEEQAAGQPTAAAAAKPAAEKKEEAPTGEAVEEVNPFL